MLGNGLPSHNVFLFTSIIWARYLYLGTFFKVCSCPIPVLSTLLAVKTSKQAVKCIMEMYISSKTVQIATSNLFNKKGIVIL